METITFASAEEAARYIGVSKPIMLAALSRGEIPARRIGRRWIISRAAVDRWLAGETSSSPLILPGDSGVATARSA